MISSLRKFTPNLKAKLLGLSEIVSQLQSEDSTTSSTDKSQSLVEDVATYLESINSMLLAQQKEMFVSFDTVQKSVLHVESNENARQACVIAYNNGAVTSNQVLNGMITGAQLVNNAIDVANRVKKVVTEDISKLNGNIDILNDWMDQMQSWTDFITEETDKIDNAQTELLRWGDKSKDTLNLHEVGIIRLGREVFDIETDILNWQNSINAIGQLLHYQPNTISVPEAASLS